MHILKYRVRKMQINYLLQHVYFKVDQVFENVISQQQITFFFTVITFSVIKQRRLIIDEHCDI